MAVTEIKKNQPTQDRDLNSRFCRPVNWSDDNGNGKNEGQSEAKLTYKDVWQALPGEIKDVFGTNGNTNKNKLAIFENSLESFLEQYSLSQLIMMSEECIGPDGRIIQDELQRILLDVNGSDDI